MSSSRRRLKRMPPVLFTLFDDLPPPNEDDRGFDDDDHVHVRLEPLDIVELGYPTGADLNAAQQAVPVFLDMCRRGDLQAAEIVCAYVLAVSLVPADFFTALTPGDGERVH